MNGCYNNISSYSATIDVKPANINSLPNVLEKIFKEKAKKYKLDWKWLAALSWVESAWRTNVTNSIGYCGLFQWHRNCKDMNHTLGRNVSNIFSVEDQTEATAKRMASNIQIAAKKGLSGEDKYLYAGVCHNAGEGGASFILGKSSPKNVYQMSQTIRNIPSSQIEWKWMRTTAKRNEISQYPFKMKSAYQSIKSKYS